MVIGLKYGKTQDDDDDARERAYALAQEFMDAFGERNSSLLCGEILGVDVSTPEGIATVRQKDLFRTVCQKFVKDAVEDLFFSQRRKGAKESNNLMSCSRRGAELAEKILILNIYLILKVLGALLDSSLRGNDGYGEWPSWRLCG